MPWLLLSHPMLCHCHLLVASQSFGFTSTTAHTARASDSRVETDAGSGTKGPIDAGASFGTIVVLAADPFELSTVLSLGTGTSPRIRWECVSFGTTGANPPIPLQH